MIKISNVYKKFANNVILDDVSFNVESGMVMGLAGPSGSGKSTLLRCIQQLDNFDAGHIECNGTTGFMFQDFQLFPHMNVLENLTYAPKLQNSNQDYKESALILLKKLGMSEKIDAHPHNLSGGQKQRVALARSLMMHPDILLCDEPTSGLDVASIADVVSLLKSVTEMGVTMIIASHDLEFLSKLSDRIILIKAGKIAADIIPSQAEDITDLLQSYYN